MPTTERNGGGGGGGELVSKQGAGKSLFAKKCIEGGEIFDIFMFPRERSAEILAMTISVKKVK